MANKTSMNVAPIKTSMSVTRKLSIAVGLLSFAAFVMQGLGDTWGFGPVAEQLTQTALLVSGGINIFFLGNSVQKNIEDRKNGES